MYPGGGFSSTFSFQAWSLSCELALSCGSPLTCLCAELQKRMTAPVIAMDGYTYEYDAIMNYFSKVDGGRPTPSPPTGRVLPSRSLLTNNTVQEMLQLLTPMLQKVMLGQ